MPRYVPHGYRNSTDGDDIKGLLQRGRAHALCTCGDLQSDHLGHSNHAQCSKCECPKFIWQSFVVNNDVPA